jgi:pyruvate dehydrogenase E1 component alpha subunit
MDVMAVMEATAQAAAEVRASGAPQFVEYRTYRFRAHSMFDAELYRSRAEVEQWKLRCPIHGFEARLRAEGLLDDAGLAAIEAEIASEIAGAVAFAEAGSWEPVENLTRDVYTERAA